VSECAYVCVCVCVCVGLSVSVCVTAVLYSSVISLCVALKEYDEAWRLLNEMWTAKMQVCTYLIHP
jgi:pentatricopeptide repeat protein